MKYIDGPQTASLISIQRFHDLGWAGTANEVAYFLRITPQLQELNIRCRILLDAKFPLTMGLLPLSSLHTMDISLTSDVVPDNLQALFPPSLRVLHLTYWFTLSTTTLPPYLTHLTLNQWRYKSAVLLPHILPTLTSLELGFYFQDRIAPSALPSSLLSLKTGEYYNQPFAARVLPPSLLRLDLSQSRSYSHTLSPTALPNSLLSIRLPPYYRYRQRALQLKRREGGEVELNLSLERVVVPSLWQKKTR